MNSQTVYVLIRCRIQRRLIWVLLIASFFLLFFFFCCWLPSHASIIQGRFQLFINSLGKPCGGGNNNKTIFFCFFSFFLHTWLYLLMTPALIMLVIPGLPSYNGVEVYYLKGVIGLPIVISFRDRWYIHIFLLEMGSLMTSLSSPGPIQISKFPEPCSKGVLLQQDNAGVHTCKVAMDAVERNGYELIPHPAYSPDLAPSDFFLFPNLKKDIRGLHFHSDEEVVTAVEEWVNGKDPDFFSSRLMALGLSASH